MELIEWTTESKLFRTENYSSQPSQSWRTTKHPTRPQFMPEVCVGSDFKFWPLMTASLLMTCSTTMNVHHWLIVIIVWV